MQVLIVSDVHGNLPALEFVLKAETYFDLLISLGDVVNYGPWSNECVELLETQKNKILILGNHEEAYINGNYAGTNKVAQAFYNHCFKTFTKVDEIKKYQIEHQEFNFLFTHTLNNQYIFPDTEIDLKQNTFIGHSHKQFKNTINNFIIANAGSVGQNRTDIDILNYALFDTESKKINLISKKFKNDMMIQEMKIQHYPEMCLNYILGKRN